MKTVGFADFFKTDLKSPSWLYNWLETHSGSFCTYCTLLFLSFTSLRSSGTGSSAEPLKKSSIVVIINMIVELRVKRQCWTKVEYSWTTVQ